MGHTFKKSQLTGFYDGSGRWGSSYPRALGHYEGIHNWRLQTWVISEILGLLSIHDRVSISDTHHWRGESAARDAVYLPIQRTISNHEANEAGCFQELAPPSTNRSCPVYHPLARLHKNSIAPFNSSGYPILLNSVSFSNCDTSSGCLTCRPRIISVII